MKLNHDAVRFILLTIEIEIGNDKRVENTYFHNKGYNNSEVDYAIKLLYDEEYIEGVDISTLGAYGYKIFGLKWKGHDLLDNIRDDGVWKETKSKAARVGSASLNILSQIAIAVITARITQ